MAAKARAATSEALKSNESDPPLRKPSKGRVTASSSRKRAAEPAVEHKPVKKPRGEHIHENIYSVQGCPPQIWQVNIDILYYYNYDDFGRPNGNQRRPETSGHLKLADT